MPTRAGQCHTALFTLRSLGDTWIKLISMDSKMKKKNSQPRLKAFPSKTMALRIDGHLCATYVWTRAARREYAV